MTVIDVTTGVDAPIHRVFDLARVTRNKALKRAAEAP
jgi:hypothetical protein